MKKILLALTTLGISLTANAELLVNQQQLQALTAEDHQAQIQSWLHARSQNDAAQALEQHLMRYPQIQQVWLRHQLLQQLSLEPALWQKQQQWIINQATSEHVLMSRLPDSGHESPIALVNIPAKAKGLLGHIAAIESAQRWQQSVIEDQFSWPLLFKQMLTLQRPKTALKAFAKQLSPSQLSTLSERLLSQKNEGIDPSNLTLFTLASHSQDSAQKQQLYLWLWSKPMDEHSVAAMNQVAANKTSVNAMELLQQAVKNPGLTSLGLNLLAKHYGEQASVVDYLFQQLSKPEHSSLAAAALATIDTAQVKQRLQQGRYSPDKVVAKASRLALSLNNTKD